MGFLGATGKFLWGTAKVATKITATTLEVAGKATVATAKVAYDNRETIGNAVAGTAKVAAKTLAVTGHAGYVATKWTAKTLYDNRDSIGGATVGVVKGIGNSVANASAHVYANENKTKSLYEKIALQSREYRRRVQEIGRQIESCPTSVKRKQLLLDSTLVGGETLAAYATGSAYVPAEVQQAYELQYPDLASKYSFVEAVNRIDSDNIGHFVSGVKGKLFEIEYVDYLNDGHLQSGYIAQLAPSANQPGWDISVIGPDREVSEMIQAKATDSVSYVKDALEKYPQFDVVTTSEVHAQLVMQGFSEHVIDSGISDAAIEAVVSGAVDGAVVSFSWMPSVLSLALIAFSSYSEKDLSDYQKSRNFGERASKSYLAYLAGGALALATNTWWIGVLGGMGSRLCLGSGQAKRQQLKSLEELIVANDRVLSRLPHLR